MMLEFNKIYYAEDYLSNYENRRDILGERFLKRLNDIEHVKKAIIY